MSISSELSSLQEQKQKLNVQKYLLIEKALKSSEPDDIIKGIQESSKFYNQGTTPTNSKSVLFDPSYANESLGYRQKPTSVSDSVLRKMAKTPIPKAIIGTRVEQVAKFSEPQPDKYSTGFVIRPRTTSYTLDEPQKKLSKEDKKIINYLTDFVLFCGADSTKWGEDNFDDFLRKIVYDSLSLDKLTFEIPRNFKNIPTEFVATDGATMYIATPPQQGQKAKKVKGYYPTYCQVYDNRIVADFYPWELCFGMRNTMTSINSNGYGVSELEDLIITVTSLLWSDEYNSRFFSHGSHPKGIMKASSNISVPKLNEFRQEWMAMMQGVYNSHKIPILEADKFEWIDMHKSNSDMEFSKFQEYLIKICCAIYKIDPSEIGFSSGDSVDHKSLFEANNEYKIKYSKDKGLKPLLKFIQFKINKHIIWEINPNYEFAFVGIDAETPQQEEDRIRQACGGTYMEINEARALRNLPSDKEEYNIVPNPVVAQMKQMQQMEQFGDQNEPDIDEGAENAEKGINNQDENPFWKDVEEFLVD